MNYKEALKQVQTSKTKDGYFVFTMGYDNKIVLPFKDGLVFLSSLNSAEQFEDPYDRNMTISSLDRTKITINRMSVEEYERIKIAALLGLTLAEVKEAASSTHSQTQ